MTNDKNVYTISNYTATWDDAIASFGGGLECGDEYLVPADNDYGGGTAMTLDGREIDSFLRRMREAMLEGVYDRTETDEEGNEWDVYVLVMTKNEFARNAGRDAFANV